MRVGDHQADAREAPPDQRIEEAHPDVWLDATFHKVRREGRVVSLATVVAIRRAQPAPRRTRPYGLPIVLKSIKARLPT